MKKARLKYLFKAIEKHIVPYLAVAFIVATSISLYLGIQAANIATHQAANDYFVTNKLASFQIHCANGITEDDITALEKSEDVDMAEGGYSTVVMMAAEDEKILLQTMSFCDEMNIPVIISGRMPKKGNEVAIEEKFANQKNLKVGDKITLEHDGELKYEEFTVSAVINQPSYCCALGFDTRGMADSGLGSSSYYIQLPLDAFDTSYYDGNFSVAYIRQNSLDNYYYFDDEYEIKETELLKELEKIGEKRAEIRYDLLLEDAQPLIDAGQMDESEIQYKEWTFSARNDMGDIRGIEGVIENVDNISYSLSVLFLIVAVIVCYSGISRMIFDQRSEIGAQKAFGFTQGEIIRHFVGYNLLCALTGIISGWGMSSAIQKLVLSIMDDEFLMGEIPPSSAPKQALLTAAICLAVFVPTAFFTTKNIVKKPALYLLRGELKTFGKAHFFEKFKLYEKLSLYSKTMIKNVLNDKERLLSTVIGIVGCMGLLVVCFSLKLAIDNSYVKQFEEYFLYENRLVYDSESGEAKDFTKVLDAENTDYIAVQDKMEIFRVDGGDWDSGRIVTTTDFEKLRDFMVLEDIETGEAAEIPDDGVLVSRKCAEEYGIKKGDVIEFMDAEGLPREFKVSGIIEHYLIYYMFVTTDEYFTEAMGREADDCVFLLKGSIDGLIEKVRDIDGFISLKDNSEFKKNSDAVYIVVGLGIVLSIAMSLLVLLNQIVMHINRKSIELAMMRINGYTMAETRAYVYKDNIFMTFLGLVLGSAVGSVLSYVVICIMEGDHNRYIRMPNVLACVMSAVICTIFALIVNIIALRKIKRLNLTCVNGN